MHKHIQNEENRLMRLVNYLVTVIGTTLILALAYLALDQDVLLRNLDFTRGKGDSSGGIRQDYFLAEVKDTEVSENDAAVFLQPGDKLILVEVISKSDRGKEIIATTSESDRNFFNDKGELLLKKGHKVVILVTTGELETFYNLVDNYRLPSTLFVIIAFVLFIVAVGRRKGLSSFVGLVSTIVILIGFIVPQILDGKSPILVSLIGSIAIALISLYLAHGFNRRTSLSVVSTLISIFTAAILAFIAVEVTNLFGLGSEEAVFIEHANLGNIDLKGILLGGIIIGALGVLDDVTTAQTATIEELKKADKKLGIKELYLRGFSVGQEHISSLVNTLVLAYAGASFPLFILLVSNTQEPLWVTLNNEYMIEEVIRTIVGSATLILAVPISTAIAAWWYGRSK